MGYLLAAIIGSIIVCIFLAVVLNGAGRKPPRGTLPSDHPVARETPSADEPTPVRSNTASKQQTNQAQRHTPAA